LILKYATEPTKSTDSTLTESTTETTAASIIASPEPGTNYCAPGGYAAILAAVTFASVHGIKCLCTWNQAKRCRGLYYD